MQGDFFKRFVFWLLAGTENIRENFYFSKNFDHEKIQNFSGNCRHTYDRKQASSGTSELTPVTGHHC